MTGQLDLLMFLALVVVIMSGFPVAFSIAGVAVLFALLGWLTGAMDIWLKKPKGENGGSMSTVSKWNQLGHGRWGKKDSDPIPTKNSFRLLEEDEQYSTF